MKASEVIGVLKDRITNLGQDIEVHEIGQVIKVYDGVVVAYGLDAVQFNEIVQFENGVQGIVFNIEEDSIGIVILGHANTVNEGEIVKRTKKVFSSTDRQGVIGKSG